MEDAILGLLRQKKRGLTAGQIAGFLRLRGRHLVRLRRALKTLYSRGAILKKKDAYLLPPETGLVRGKFLPSSRGFGFVRPEGGEHGEDIFVPGRASLGALAGDTVEVRVRQEGKKGRAEGRVVRVLKKGREFILGLYQERYGEPYVVPFESASLEEIPLRSKSPLHPSPGMIVEVDREKMTVRNVLGFPDDPGVDTRVIIERFNLAVRFSPEAEREASLISRRITARDREGRKDFRRWRTVTIDGENAQDFDDAVSIRILPSGNALLGVHIADVSHYVRPGSALDREARERATSVYLPGVTLPMLPEVLSNDLCSLRPRRTRLTISACLEFDRQGRPVKADFYPSVIRTAERLTYTSVFKIFQGDEEERRKYSPLVPDLLLMRELAAKLRARREERGSLNFDLLEPELVYQEGRLTAVAAFEANEAHHLIEEFMVAANQAVAGFLCRRKLPAIFRVHPPPTRSDLEELRSLLGPFGLLLPKPEKITSADLGRVLKQAEGKPEEKFVQFQVLRALRLAVYSAENTGHYGLAIDEYTHFTSPIRRYPDLVVHRILKAALQGERLRLPALPSLALHCSEQERKADEAEKELVEWRIYRFLKAKLGEEFDGIIVGITRAGVVVELMDYFVDGLVSWRDLGDDYYQQRSGRMLVGRRSGRAFELGDRVRVILAAVDPLSRRLTLVLSRKSKGEER